MSECHAVPPSATRSARNLWNARQRGQLTKGAPGRRAARRRTSRRSTSSKTCHRAGVWRKLFSSPIGAIDEMRFVVRSLGTISSICQRARRRHRRSARLVCGTAPGRQAAHVSQSSRVVRRIRGAGCRARPRWASEAKRRGHERVILGAQLTAIPFYEKLGYAAYGPEFDDAGIPHRMMEKPL